MHGKFCQVREIRAAVEPRIKLGPESPWESKTLCLSHLWASHHGIEGFAIPAKAVIGPK